jgi:hypothetical protein
MIWTRIWLIGWPVASRIVPVMAAPQVILRLMSFTCCPSATEIGTLGPRQGLVAP